MRTCNRLVLGVLLTGLGWLLPAGTAGAAESVTMNQGWVIAGKYAPMHIADEKGWYAARGLKVTLRRGFGSVAQAKSVAEGTSDYTMDVDTSVLIQARSRGAKIKEVGMVYGKFPVTMNSLVDPKTGKPAVTRASDLEGKRVGLSTGSTTYGLWKAYARETGIDTSKVTIVNMKGSEVYVPALLAGSVDVIFGFHASDNAVAVVSANKLGKKMHIVSWAQDAPRFAKSYANGMIVRDEEIEKRPQVVAAMVQETFRGFAYCMARFEECIGVLKKRFPEMGREVAEIQLAQILDAVLSPEAVEKGLGYMRPDKMAYTTNLMNEINNLNPPIRPEDVFTNRFVKKIELPADYAKWNKL